MIVYFDTSALVKRYIKEAGSSEVNALVENMGNILGSALITQVEMAAAFRRAVSMGAIPDTLLLEIWQDFFGIWESFTRIQVSDALVAKANQIAFDYKLRGYDSLHLAAAMIWQESLGMPVTLATFDRELWLAAHEAGLDAWPEEISNQ
jgi:predicted nucleic acid-binding protein